MTVCTASKMSAIPLYTIILGKFQDTLKEKKKKYDPEYGFFMVFFISIKNRTQSCTKR